MGARWPLLIVLNLSQILSFDVRSILDTLFDVAAMLFVRCRGDIEEMLGGHY